MQERPETVPVSMKLENLTSYHNYTVSVVACTTACSEKSPPVTVQTDIGGRLLAHYCMFSGDIAKSLSMYMYQEKANDYVVGTGIEPTATVRVCIQATK
jgi:hypothetical protein